MRLTSLITAQLIAAAASVGAAPLLAQHVDTGVFVEAPKPLTAQSQDEILIHVTRTDDLFDDRTEHNRLILERFTHLALRVKLDSNKALDVDGQPVALPQAPNQHPFQGVSEDPNDVPVTVETVKAEVYRLNPAAMELLHPANASPGAVQQALERAADESLPRGIAKVELAVVQKFMSASGSKLFDVFLKLTEVEGQHLEQGEHSTQFGRPVFRVEIEQDGKAHLNLHPVALAPSRRPGSLAAPPRSPSFADWLMKTLHLDSVARSLGIPATKKKCHGKKHHDEKRMQAIKAGVAGMRERQDMRNMIEGLRMPTRGGMRREGRPHAELAHDEFKPVHGEHRREHGKHHHEHNHEHGREHGQHRNKHGMKGCLKHKYKHLRHNVAEFFDDLAHLPESEPAKFAMLALLVIGLKAFVLCGLIVSQRIVNRRLALPDHDDDEDRDMDEKPPAYDTRNAAQAQEKVGLLVDAEPAGDQAELAAAKA